MSTICNGLILMHIKRCPNSLIALTAEVKLMKEDVRV